jgi:hypothetical protein
MTDEEDFPRQDPLVKWRSEAAAQERRRRFAKRALRRQEQRTTAATAATQLEGRVNAQLSAQKEFLIECCGQALGRLTEELRDDFMSKVDALEKHYKGLQDLYTRELAVANSHIQLLQRQLNQIAIKLYGSDAAPAAHGSALPKYDA